MYKKLHEFLSKHKNAIIAIEKLDKVNMFKDAGKSLSRKICRTAWVLFHKVLKDKAWSIQIN